MFCRSVSIEEYPYSKYPDFCQGAFYLMQISTAEKLYDLFQTEFFKNFIWMEDVLLTGRFKVSIQRVKSLWVDRIIFLRLGTGDTDRWGNKPGFSPPVSVPSAQSWQN